MKNKIILTIIILSMIALVFSGCGGTTTPTIPSDSLVAVITSSTTSGEAPLEVTFDASESSSAEGDEIVSYEWDFEDGKTGEGRIVHHGFDSPGNYTVILTISDNKGAVDTSSVIIRVSQPTETVIEQNFDTQNGTELDTGTGLKIIIPPTSIEGQMNLEVRYDSSPSQSASDLMNLHSSYSISIIPQKGFQEKELMKSGIKKDQETMKVSFIFDVPEDVDPQSLAIFEWTDEGWCLAGVGDIETIEQLGGVLSFDGTQISIEIPNFSNYSKYLNSRDSRYDDTMLLDITLSTGNFNSTDPYLIEDTDTSRCPMESETIETIDSGDHIKKVYFQSLDFGIVGYSTGIPYKVGVNNNENLIGKPDWNQPSTGLYTDIYQILGLSGWYLMPSDDDAEKGVLTLQFGPEGGNCTVWLEADGGMLFGEWLLSAIPGVSISSTMADTIRIYIEDAGNYLMGDSVDTNILVEKTKKMVIELVKEGIKLHPVGLLLTSAVKLGELKARVEIYLKMTRGPHNPCPHYKSPGYWEWKIIVPPITPKTYTITASSGSHGSISPSGDVTVNQGSDQSFTITPDSGYSIDDVLVDGSSVGTVSSYTFINVTEDHSISATFTSAAPGLVHNLTKGTYYDTIQAALDDADNDNIIKVSDGTYDESIVFPSGKIIILQSANGASSTTIRGDDGSPTVTLGSSLEGTTLEGFTITHASGNDGRGIYTDENLAIKNCIISGNSAGDGGGIYNQGLSITITGSTISGNSAYYWSSGYGGGICNEWGSITITGSTISGNTASGYGGGIYNQGLSITITGSTVSGNTSHYNGGGIYNYIYGDSITITGSTISDNTSHSNGGGIYFNYWISGTPLIGGSSDAKKNIICGNHKIDEVPSLDQQIRDDDSGNLYETYKDTNYISAYCE